MDSRTKFVVIMMGILFIFSWFFSMLHFLDLHVWDQQYALDKLHASEPEEIFYSSTELNYIYESYLSWRYIWFFPHVSAAVLWWNLYFLQLIPSIRKRFRWLHRWLGMLLLFVAFAQVVSGVGLACTSHSTVIKSVSFLLAAAVAYCIQNAWIYARARDIKRHRFWALRLVGYLQTIAAQRFWLGVLIGTHQAGVTFFYPSIEGLSQAAIDAIVMRMFDDSFVLAFGTSCLVTEWYLSAEVGMVEPPTHQKAVVPSTSK